MSEEQKPKVGKPVKITIPCAGLAPGESVTVKVFEPHALGGDPIDTLTAAVDDGAGVATVSWTYDHAAHADQVSAARFVFVAEGAGRTSVSPPVEFVDTFEATVQDGSGRPAGDRLVVLHAARGPNVRTATNALGKIKIDVPPGQYHVELLGPAPPDMVRPALPRKNDVPPAASASPADTGSSDASDTDGGAAAEAPADASDAATDASDSATDTTAVYFLAARFFCRLGLTPVGQRSFEVAGQQGQTDDKGCASLPNMPCQPLDVQFDGGTVTVPAVHDASLVLKVRLPFVDPAPDAPPQAYGDDASQGPSGLFPGGDKADDDGTQPVPDDPPPTLPPPDQDTHVIARTPQ